MSQAPRRHPVAALVLAAFLVVGFVFGTAALHAARDRAAGVAVFAAQASHVDRYVQELLLEDLGQPASPEALLQDLYATVAVFLDGGEVRSLQGSSDVRVSVRPAQDGLRPKLVEFWSGLELLEATTLEGEVGDADRAASIQALRVEAALIRSVATDAAGQMTVEAQQLLQKQLALGAILGLLLLGGGTAALVRERRVGREVEVARFRAIVAEATDWIAVLDRDLRITFSTAGSVALLGVAPEELLGRPLGDVIAEGDAMLRATLRQHGESPDQLLTLNVRDGDDWRRVAFRVADHRRDPHIDGWVLTGRDDRGPQALRDELVMAVHRDELTGLSNRVDVLRDLTVRLAQMGSGGARPIVIAVDLDRFRDINLRHGSVTGDGVLRRIGEALQGWAPPTAVVARTGDDEYVLVLDGDTSSTPGELAEHVLRRISGSVRVDEVVVQIRACVVARRAASDERDAALVLQDAVAAMDALKMTGGNAASEATTVELLTDD